MCIAVEIREEKSNIMQTAESNISWDQLRFPFYIVYGYNFKIKSFLLLSNIVGIFYGNNNHKILLINLEAFILWHIPYYIGSSKIIKMFPLGNGKT